MSRNAIIGIVGFLLLAILGLLVSLYLMLNQEKPTARKRIPHYNELLRTSEQQTLQPNVAPGQYTREVIDKLELGMSRDEVERILARPGKKMHFPSAPKDVSSFSWDTRFPTHIVITFKQDKVIGISAPVELTPGMIAAGTSSKAAPKLVYTSSMVKSAFAKWDVAKGQIVIIGFNSVPEGSDRQLAARVFPRAPKDREKGALFELVLRMPESAAKPQQYRFTLFKQTSWPAVYSCDICGLMSKKGEDAARDIKSFKGKATVGSLLKLRVVGKSREPMFENSVHARWDLDLQVKVLVVK